MTLSLRTEAVLAGTRMAALPGSEFDIKSAETTGEPMTSRPAIIFTLIFASVARIIPDNGQRLCWM